ncbi:hypothetical protein [Streptomyces boninensis]|uniref:hypothetical protein n=1 Tax=Streptomyces boninensis TaxID=2039455 RepID=UPI003B221C53
MPDLHAPAGGGDSDSLDYFDRLLARHTPVRAASAPADSVRARPRLPGPFERAEAVWSEEAEETVAAQPLRPAADVRPGAGVVRHEREIRTTERETVLRTEPAAPAPEPDRPAPAAALLRPAAPAGPALRPPASPARTGGARTGELATGAERPATDAAPAAIPPPGTGAAAVSAAPSPRPGAADTALARTAARVAGRRGARAAAERTVHVQIGRLEVSAAGAGGGRPAEGRRDEGRRAPAVSLADYLARAGQDGDRGGSRDGGR